MSCTACECGPPEGGDCVAEVTAYEDDACTVEIPGKIVGLGTPECSEAVVGQDLQGMSATWIQNQPGDCTPSGGKPWRLSSILEDVA